MIRAIWEGYCDMWRDALWHPAISHRYLSRFCLVFVTAAAGLCLGFAWIFCYHLARIVGRLL